MTARSPTSFRSTALRIGMAVVAASTTFACAPVRPAPARPAPAAPAVAPTPSRPMPYVVIRLRERRLDYMREGEARPAVSFPIAVGRRGHETPTGTFRVEEMVEHPDFLKFDPKDPKRVIGRIPPGPQNPLGERWIGFAHGDGWTVGMHGTPHPELLGKAVSGGCIRMRNADVIWLYERVGLGTTVVVRP